MVFQGPEFLRRKGAAEYLRTRYGFGTVASLSKLAVVGGGPEFRKLGKIVLYEPATLDRWARQRMSEPRASTSASA